VTRAVFFDVDFTLIRPGESFLGPGYRDFCARHGVVVDAERFNEAVLAASPVLNSADDSYDPQVFIDYTTRIIQGMGGSGDGVDAASRDIYDEWSACHHFTLYDDVPQVMRELRDRGMTIGLISNTQRCLASFQSHFALDGMIEVAVSSAEHGYMKPHPSIFRAALTQAGVPAEESLMVGDSLMHDVLGARRLGMRAVLLSRGAVPPGCPDDIPVITTLTELLALI